MELLEPRQLLSGVPADPGAIDFWLSGGDEHAVVQAASASVATAAPRVEVTAAIGFDHGGATGSVGDGVTATLVLANRPGTSAADALALQVDFPLPAAGQSWITAPSFTVTDTAGIVTAAGFELVGSAAAGWRLRSRPGVTFDLPVDAGRTITLAVRGTVSNAIVPGNTARSAAVVDWTSLAGDPGRAVALADLRAADFGFSMVVVSTSDPATDGGWVTTRETVRHRVVVVIPQGSISTNSARLRVEIPAGMRFLNNGSARVALVSNGGLSSSRYPAGSGAYVSGGRATNVEPTFTVPAGTITGGSGDGDFVEFDFGRVSNDDTDSNDEFIILEFDTRVTTTAATLVPTGPVTNLVTRARMIIDGSPLLATATDVVTFREVPPDVPPEPAAEPPAPEPPAPEPPAPEPPAPEPPAPEPPAPEPPAPEPPAPEPPAPEPPAPEPPAPEPPAPEPPAPEPRSSPVIVTGAGIGASSGPWVTVLDAATGSVMNRFLAYEPGFRGGVRVALGDVTGDGLEEIITAPGPGRVGEIRVFRQDGRELPAYRTLPFAAAYRGGVEVAAGDFNGDGVADLVAAASRGPGLVRVFLIAPRASRPVPAAATHSLTVFPAWYLGGATVTTADIGTFSAGRAVDPGTPDGRMELVIGSGPSLAPVVLVYDLSGPPAVVRRIEPFSPALRGGISVAAGRHDGDAIDDIIVAGGRRAGSAIEVHSGRESPGRGSLLARQVAFAGLGLPIHAVGVDHTGDGRIDSLVAVQTVGTGQGIRRLGGSPAVETTLARLAGPLVITASRPPRR